ncbi:MAG: hypothetical protein QOH48_2009 [Actinomycetota bacterium]|nr:hypothetical protein [Actinomycetota bacterium]
MILTGRVTLNGLSTAQQAVVELHNSEGDVLDQMQVDRSGIYAFHLIAGTWSLRAWDQQGRRALAEIEVADEDTIFDIDLTEPEGARP